MRSKFLTVSRAFECPDCDNHGSKVIESRSTIDRESVIRVRKCNNCHREFSTIEIPMNKRLTRGEMERVLSKIDRTIDLSSSRLMP